MSVETVKVIGPRVVKGIQSCLSVAAFSEAFNSLFLQFLFDIQPTYTPSEYLQMDLTLV